MPQTDKMLSRKEGSVGYRDLQQSGAAQRRLARHVGGGAEHPRRLRATTTTVRVVVRHRRRRQGLRVRRRHLEIREGALQRGGGRALQRRRSTRAYTAFYEFPKPTIAMIRGYCIGGGLGLAICCDLRICSENSNFGVPAAKLGLGYGYHGLKRLVDVVGPSFAKEIFYTARQFAAAEAHEMGLVNRVVPDGELESLREELCRHDRRQCAAHRQGGQGHRRRGAEGRKPSAT